jgi:hypothetical protein
LVNGSNIGIPTFLDRIKLCTSSQSESTTQNVSFIVWCFVAYVAKRWFVYNLEKKYKKKILLTEKQRIMCILEATLPSSTAKRGFFI